MFEENKSDFFSEPTSVRGIESNGQMDMNLISLGVKTLSRIPSQATCNTLFSRHINPNDGWIRLAGESLSDSIFESFGAYLQTTRVANLEDVAHLICRNTSSFFKEESEPVKWINSFSGRNLRWESLGILFTYWSFGAISSPEHDLIYQLGTEVKRDRRQYMIEMKECATWCIALSSNVDRGNPLLVYLLYKHSLLETIISGDASKSNMFDPSTGEPD